MGSLILLLHLLGQEINHNTPQTQAGVAIVTAENGPGTACGTSKSAN